MIFYRNWHKPKLLTIDLDDTLYDNGPVIARAEEYIKTKIGVEYLDGSRLSDSLYYAVRGKMLDVCPELEYDVSMLRYFIFKELLTGSGRTSDDACRLAEDLMHDFISVRSEINVPRETLERKTKNNIERFHVKHEHNRYTSCVLEMRHSHRI